MSELIDKLSSYNLFNYLLPGALFAVIADSYTSLSFTQEDILLGFFTYYFYGLVISRIGSLIVEPALKKSRIIKFVDYGKFVAASKRDEKINELSEANNMYRTLCSLFLILALVIAFDNWGKTFPWLGEHAKSILLASLFIVFLLSYRKQSAYIVKRVLAAESEDK